MVEESPPKKRAPRKRADAPQAEGAAPAPVRARRSRNVATPELSPGAVDASTGSSAKKPASPRKRTGVVAKSASTTLATRAVSAPPGHHAVTAKKAAPRSRANPAPASRSAPPATTADRRKVAPASAAKRPAGRSASTRAPVGSPPVRSPPGKPRSPTARSAPTGGWRTTLSQLEHGLERADPYLRLCRLDRPIGFLLLLWPTWWGLWAAAEGFPPWRALVIFTLGVILMRSAGCVINDYADRWLDPQVQRTKSRPLAAGEVAPKQALALFAGLLLGAFILVLFTNTLTLKLAVVGAVLAATYPFLKRYTHLPQIYLGIAFGWAIPMAFAAVQGEVPRLAWLLFLANVLWSTAYDTLYAMVDRDDDIKAGAKSTAILFGDVDLIAVGLLHGTFLLTMVFVGQRLALGWPWWLALATAAALCAGQLWRARARDRAGCFRAFQDNNWVGMIIFLGLAGALALR